MKIDFSGQIGSLLRGLGFDPEVFMQMIEHYKSEIVGVLRAIDGTLKAIRTQNDVLLAGQQEILQRLKERDLPPVPLFSESIPSDVVDLCAAEANANGVVNPRPGDQFLG